MTYSSSRRWANHRKKKTTSKCLIIDVSEIVFQVTKLHETQGIVALSLGSKVSDISLIWCCSDLKKLKFRLKLRIQGVIHNELVVKTYRTLHVKNSIRHWFCCPGVMCKKRVKKLYIPSPDAMPACRDCHNLTYESSQKQRRITKKERWISEYLNVEPEFLRKAILYFKKHFVRDRYGILSLRN